jgi:hypothetical protein
VTTNGDDGTRVVKARVRARLLGLELLTLDATVVLGQPEALAKRRSAPIPATGTLVDAVRLLEEGDQQLIEAGSLRARLANDSGPRPTDGRRSPRRTRNT